MSTTQWLRAQDCTLLRPDAEADILAVRSLQRLLELALTVQGSAACARVLLEDIAAAVHADVALVAEARPDWEVVWHHTKRGGKPASDSLPRGLLREVLDRDAGVCQGPALNQPAQLAACLGYVERPNRALLLVRPREAFTATELEYAVAAAHYLGLTLEHARQWDQAQESRARLHTLVAIAEQLVEQRDTPSLLEHIAGQAARLLQCERASIFLWDKSRKELVGRPALGVPGGELRIPEDTGIVGKVIHSGQPAQLDDVREDRAWKPTIDVATGFKTRNILCVPLNDAANERLGAFEVMNKEGAFAPEDIETLQALGRQTAAALNNVRERETLIRSNTQLEGQARMGARMVGASPAIAALRATAERVARTDLPVLILGESGTGKDVVARVIHYNSPRLHSPFIPVNCAAIAETLIESELFGHEKGAFTDAHTTRQGKFEAASGGTLFLDEVGDLSAGGQAKLLRVLEEKVVYRVGGTQPIPVDTRIIAATNRNLAERVRAGKFREDLFYRLTVVQIDLPPLRDRRDDILLLAEHFMGQFCQDAGRKQLKFSAEARKRLEQHNWPGNVRELRNLLERVAYLCPGDKVEADDLAFILRPPGGGDDDAYSDLTLADATDAFQRDHIQRAIDRARRNMTDVAKLLGLHRPNLYRKMKLLGMDVKEYK
jgi:transcriptional regulator with GAF, ATPase, and Fis domain